MDLFDLPNVLIYYILSFYISDRSDLVILSNVSKKANQYSINARTALFSSIGSSMIESHKGKFPELMRLLNGSKDIPFPAPDYVYSPQIVDIIMREYFKRIVDGAAFKEYVDYLTSGRKSIAHIIEIIDEVKRNHPMAIIDTTKIAHSYRFVLSSLLERYDYFSIVDNFFNHLLDVLIELPKPVLFTLFAVIDCVVCSLNESCASTFDLPFIPVHATLPFTVGTILSLYCILFMVLRLKARQR